MEVMVGRVREMKERVVRYMAMDRNLASDMVRKTRYKSAEHVERIVASGMNGGPIGGCASGAREIINHRRLR
jgi:hypothetical protein